MLRPARVAVEDSQTSYSKGANVRSREADAMAAHGRTRPLTSRGSKAALAASGTLTFGAIVGEGAEVVSRIGPSMWM